LGARYTDIVAILHSSHLTPTVQNAQEAASSVQGHITIQVIDSQTTAVGLGLLVQEAARAAEEEVPSVEIERSIRNLVSRVYTLFCIEGLTYLHHMGELGAAQALVGEFLDVMPIYILDSGQLVPTQKARNNRHLVDIMHEFLYEFLDLEHIALLQGVPPFEQETRALRERITDDFGETPISEHTISATLATLLGPRTLGLFAMQYE
jgi:DegV family protein with EDD domain